MLVLEPGYDVRLVLVCEVIPVLKDKTNPTRLCGDIHGTVINEGFFFCFFLF